MMIRGTQRSRTRAAFTLMEMLVVVAIIVALASIGGFFLLQQLSDSKKDIAQAHIRGVLSPAVKTYSIKRGKFPSELSVLREKDEYGGPYLESDDALKDPWGNFYQYNNPGTRQGANTGSAGQPDIYAIPPDAQGEQDWIGNWPKTKR